MFTTRCAGAAGGGWTTSDSSASRPDSQPARVLVESYPYAAWKSLGLTPLPSKRRAKVSDLAEAFGALRALIPIHQRSPAQSRPVAGHRRRIARPGPGGAQHRGSRASSAIRRAAKRVTGARASSCCPCPHGRRRGCAGSTEQLLNWPTRLPHSLSSLSS